MAEVLRLVSVNPGTLVETLLVEFEVTPEGLLVPHFEPSVNQFLREDVEALASEAELRAQYAYSSLLHVRPSE